MAARQQFQRSSNSSHSSHSSHPSSQFRDKSKYNNTRGGSNTRSEGKPNRGENGENAVVSQEELTQFLVSKLRDNRFVEVTTNEIKNDRGTLFEIDVKNGGLFRIGNGTFFSLKLHTVSHKSRVIFATIVFNREVVNEERIRINSDSIIQIFRELAPNTIDKISIQHLGENKPLAVVVSTIKGASLNYTYERALEFIHVVDEKYGSDAGASQNADASAGAVVGDSTNPEEMTPDQIDLEAAMLEKKLSALMAIKVSKSSANAGASPSAMPGEDETTTSTPAPAAKAASAPSSRSSSPTKFRIMVGDKKMN